MPGIARRAVQITLDDEAIEQLEDGDPLEFAIAGTDYNVRIDYDADLEDRLRRPPEDEPEPGREPEQGAFQ